MSVIWLQNKLLDLVNGHLVYSSSDGCLYWTLLWWIVLNCFSFLAWLPWCLVVHWYFICCCEIQNQLAMVFTTCNRAAAGSSGSDSGYGGQIGRISPQNFLPPSSTQFNNSVSGDLLNWLFVGFAIRMDPCSCKQWPTCQFSSFEIEIVHSVLGWSL